MAERNFQVKLGIHPKHWGEMTRNTAISILKEFDESLRHGVILRSTGLSTAIEYLEREK